MRAREAEIPLLCCCYRRTLQLAFLGMLKTVTALAPRAAVRSFICLKHVLRILQKNPQILNLFTVVQGWNPQSYIYKASTLPLN